jgi:hypothetical protein
MFRSMSNPPGWPKPNIATASRKVKVLFHGKGASGASCCKMWQEAKASPYENCFTEQPFRVEE